MKQDSISQQSQDDFEDDLIKTLLLISREIDACFINISPISLSVFMKNANRF